MSKKNKKQPIKASSTRSHVAKTLPRSTRRLPVWGWALAGILFVAAIYLAVRLIGVSSPATASLPDEITPQQAQQEYQKGVYVLDVRTTEEWNQAHIPNTTLIPLDELPNRVSEVPKDQQVIVVCRSGNRSQQGRDILRSAGYTQVTSMAGGLNQWSALGYATVSGP